MRAFLILGFGVISFSCLFAAPALKNPNKIDNNIVGEWKFVRVSSGGSITEVDDHSIFTFHPDGSLLREGVPTPTYTINLKKKTPEIDIVPHENDPSPVMRGIYQIDGDMLMIVVTFSKDAERPTEFVSAEGLAEGQELFMLELRARED